MSSQVRQAASDVLGAAVTWVATPAASARPHYHAVLLNGARQRFDAADVFLGRKAASVMMACVWSGVPQ